METSSTKVTEEENKALLAALDRILRTYNVDLKSLRSDTNDLCKKGIKVEDLVNIFRALSDYKTQQEDHNKALDRLVQQEDPYNLYGDADKKWDKDLSAWNEYDEALKKWGESNEDYKKAFERYNKNNEQCKKYGKTLKKWLRYLSKGFGVVVAGAAITAATTATIPAGGVGGVVVGGLIAGAAGTCNVMTDVQANIEKTQEHFKPLEELFEAGPKGLKWWVPGIALVRNTGESKEQAQTNAADAKSKAEQSRVNANELEEKTRGAEGVKIYQVAKGMINVPGPEGDNGVWKTWASHFCQGVGLSHEESHLSEFATAAQSKALWFGYEVRRICKMKVNKLREFADKCEREWDEEANTVDEKFRKLNQELRDIQKGIERINANITKKNDELKTAQRSAETHAQNAVKLREGVVASGQDFSQAVHENKNKSAATQVEVQRISQEIEKENKILAMYQDRQNTVEAELATLEDKLRNDESLKIKTEKISTLRLKAERARFRAEITNLALGGVSSGFSETLFERAKKEKTGEAWNNALQEAEAMIWMLSQDTSSQNAELKKTWEQNKKNAHFMHLRSLFIEEIESYLSDQVEDPRDPSRKPVGYDPNHPNIQAIRDMATQLQEAVKGLSESIKSNASVKKYILGGEVNDNGRKTKIEHPILEQVINFNTMMADGKADNDILSIIESREAASEFENEANQKSDADSEKYILEAMSTCMDEIANFMHDVHQQKAKNCISKSATLDRDTLLEKPNPSKPFFEYWASEANSWCRSFISKRDDKIAKSEKEIEQLKINATIPEEEKINFEMKSRDLEILRQEKEAFEEYQKSVEAELVRIRAGLDVLNSQLIAQQKKLEGDKADFEKEKTALAASHEDIQKQHDAALALKASAEKMLQDAQSVKEKAGQIVSEAETKIKEYETELTCLKEKLKTCMQVDRDDLEQTITELQGKIDELTLQQTQAKKIKEEQEALLNQFKEERRQAQEEIKKLKKTISEQRAAHAQVVQAKDEAIGAKNEVIETKNELIKAQRETIKAQGHTITQLHQPRATGESAQRSENAHEEKTPLELQRALVKAAEQAAKRSGNWQKAISEVTKLGKMCGQQREDWEHDQKDSIFKAESLYPALEKQQLAQSAKRNFSDPFSQNTWSVTFKTLAIQAFKEEEQAWKKAAEFCNTASGAVASRYKTHWSSQKESMESLQEKARKAHEELATPN